MNDIRFKIISELSMAQGDKSLSVDFSDIANRIEEDLNEWDAEDVINVLNELKDSDYIKITSGVIPPFVRPWNRVGAWKKENHKEGLKLLITLKGRQFLYEIERQPLEIQTLKSTSEINEKTKTLIDETISNFNSQTTLGNTSIIIAGLALIVSAASPFISKWIDSHDKSKIELLLKEYSIHKKENKQLKTDIRSLKSIVNELKNQTPSDSL